MIEVYYSEQCMTMMQLAEIPKGDVHTTVNDRHCGLATPGLSRILAAHWFSDTRIIFVDARVMEKEVRQLGDGTQNTKFESVEASVVLELTPSLPSGLIRRDMPMVEVFGIIAASFGYPFKLTLDSAAIHHYSGPWQKNAIDVNAPYQATVALLGSPSQDETSMAFLWVFALDRYREWFCTPQ